LAVLDRRAEARELVANNPELARDLRVGRPDLPRQYDDGGLVDINAVPAVLIARECGLDDAVAEQIQSARQRHPVPFGSVDELLVFAGLDVSTWDRLRDRAVVYS
jgi:DNA uptake protein ComE-like DNA-binding protein